ncbi:MAG TPA: gliding motility-associated C-terminal domain-containing protein [Chitinophagaceae bacterium]|nr:gliding motility-associated C-terminal domain-containing protein [Chitinophagaceae bacterium]
MKTLSLIFTVLFFQSVSFAQKEMNNWFFAQNLGLNFSTGQPVQIAGGQIVRMEGGSAISDANGNLLFYTDGYAVWDRKHNLMPNGDALMGGYSSSTQSSLIIPKPDDNQHFYIFTADEEGGPNGFRYSEVDITLNNGLGDITGKNILLHTPVSEKIAATRHCNGKDIWVVTHEYGSDAFYAYLVTATGINTTPVISHTGNFIPVAFATMAGQLKISRDGTKIAAAHGVIGVDLLDFNNQTGIASNPLYIYDNSNSIPYGVEFSPNSSMLYISVSNYWEPDSVKRYTGVFQYDLSLPTSTDIKNSKTIIYRVDQPREFGSLQLAPDGKIYMPEYRRSYLSVVSAPNVLNTGCNFIPDAIGFSTNTLFNLPNFAPFAVKDSFNLVGNPGFCMDDTIRFYSQPGNITAVQWDFGDPSSGASNYSSIANPYHIYSTGGNYNVRLIKIGVCRNDTLRKTVTIGDVLVNLGNDTTYCGQQNFILDPHVTGSNSYLWQNGLTTPSITATAPGLYWIEVKGNTNGCIRRDSIILISKPVPVVNLGRDSGLCANQQLLLDAQNPGANYLWNNNTAERTLLATQGGLYWVKVTSNECSFTDTIIIKELRKPVFTLGPDQLICAGQTVQLKINLPGVNYLWQDGSMSSTYNVTKEGLYFADVTNQCGITRDSINFIKSECVVYVPNAFTPNSDGKNDLFRASGTGSVTEFEMNVYNRWGRLIFTTKDKLKGWNGTLNSMLQPGGVYVWTVRFKTTSNPKEELMKGTVMLIR